MDNVCPLCDRSLGQKVEKHHVIPKSKGGRETVEIHPICHRKIHKVFTRTQLANLGSISALRSHPEIEKFVKWVSKKPADFHAPTR